MTKPLDYFLRLLAAFATFAILYFGVGMLLKALLPDLAFSTEIAIGVGLIAAFAVVLARPYLKVAIPFILIGLIATLTPALLKALGGNSPAPTVSSTQPDKPDAANDAKKDEDKPAAEKPKNSYSQ